MLDLSLMQPLKVNFIIFIYSLLLQLLLKHLFKQNHKKINFLNRLKQEKNLSVFPFFFCKYLFYYYYSYSFVWLWRDFRFFAFFSLFSEVSTSSCRKFFFFWRFFAFQSFILLLGFFYFLVAILEEFSANPYTLVVFVSCTSI